MTMGERVVCVPSISKTSKLKKLHRCCQDCFTGDVVCQHGQAECEAKQRVFFLCVLLRGGVLVMQDALRYIQFRLIYLLWRWKLPSKYLCRFWDDLPPQQESTPGFYTFLVGHPYVPLLATVTGSIGMYTWIVGHHIFCTWFLAVATNSYLKYPLILAKHV